MSTSTSLGVSSTVIAPITASIGKKILMAITGFVSFGYVVGHMVGNLQIFIGQDQINQYAEFLHSMGPMLWVVRAALICFFAVHIWMGIQTKLENWRSRPVGYKYSDTVQATLSSRTMIYTGLMVFSFFVYHILHFTAHVTNPRYVELIDAQGRFDAYSMIILGFQNYWISGVYIIAVALVAFHINHGISSMFQSMGWIVPGCKKNLERIATVVALLIFIGFASIPAAILGGFITLPEGVI
jgi:succinate dehydrogenase / fumarate reductase cytochrome b subunit